MSTIDWLAAISGDYKDAADWKGGKVPGPADSGVIDAIGARLTVVRG